MSKSKWPTVQEKIKNIEKWAMDGLENQQIAKNLGVHVSTFCDYLNKYPELVETLKRGREPYILEVRKALVDRALGMEHEETKTYIRMEGDKRVSYQEKTVKYFPPDPGSAIYILKNRDKDANGKALWSNDPAKIELDREALTIKQELLKIKQELGMTQEEDLF